MPGYDDKIKKYYEDLSREEFIELLEGAGFEVEDGCGEILYSEIEIEVNFTINGTFSSKNNKSYISITSNSFPKAS